MIWFEEDTWETQIAFLATASKGTTELSPQTSISALQAQTLKGFGSSEQASVGNIDHWYPNSFSISFQQQIPAEPGNTLFRFPFLLE